MRQQKYSFHLPTQLFEEVKRLFPKNSKRGATMRNEALRTLHVISLLATKQNGSPDQYAEIGHRYFRKMFDGRYLTMLNILKDNKIIETLSNTSNGKDTYKVKNAKREVNGKIIINKEGICKKYRISSIYSYNNSIINNTNILDNNTNINKGVFICRHFLAESSLNNSLSEVSYSYKPKENTEEGVAFERQMREMIDTLKIDYAKLYKEAQKIINNLDINDYLMSEYEDMDKIERFHMITGGYTIPMKISQAFSLAAHRHESVFRTKKGCFIGGREQFMERLRTNKSISYLSSIQALETGEIRCSRNTNNNRLDSNFTNMKSKFVDIICKDNNLVQLDMSNSQFTILANYLKNKKGMNTKDFNLFYNLATKGILYEEISKMTGLNRKESKQLMFQILFNKVNANIKHKEKLMELFPTVMEYINNFKKSQGYKSFSVFLQKLESKMFVDDIYPRVLEQTGFVITKHDSVIVREGDKEIVIEVLKDYFKENNFIGKIS